jgi:O-antigen/teichoic acid export membrane protein
MINRSSLKNKHFLALTGNIIISAFSIIIMSLLYRSMSKPDIGSWFFFLSIQSVAESFRAGFLGTATVKFYAGTTKERAEAVLGSIWVSAVFITGIVMLLNGVLWLFTKDVDYPQMLIVIKWLGVTFLSTLPFTVTTWILMADENYSKILWLRLVNSGSMFIIIAVLIWMNKMSLENLMILNFVTNVFSSLFCMFMNISRFRTIIKFTKEITVEISHFGKYSLGSSISTILFKNADTFIITMFLGPAALAIYNIPGRLMTVIELPLGSFIGTGMSAMASAINRHRKDEVLNVFKKYIGLITFSFIPIVILCIIFADVAVSILGGSKYVGTEAANIFRIMIFTSLLFPFDRFSGVTLDMLHLPHVNFQKVLIMLFFSIGSTFTGILIFKNLYGIAFMSPVTIISGAIFGYYTLRKHLDFTIKDIIITGLNESKIKLVTVSEKFKGFLKAKND